MLSHLDEVEFECAEDGKLVILYEVKRWQRKTRER